MGNFWGTLCVSEGVDGVNEGQSICVNVGDNESVDGVNEGKKSVNDGNVCGNLCGEAASETPEIVLEAIKDESDCCCC